MEQMDCVHVSAVDRTVMSMGISSLSIKMIACRSVGRNPLNPSDRRRGIYLEQRIEIGGEVSNCLTNVAKDSYVIEIDC